MIMFYYRFAIDVILGILVFAFLTLSVLYGLFSEQLDYIQKFIFYFALPSSNMGATRSLITLTITVERCLAAYTPIFFHNFRDHFPTVLILVVALLFGFFESVVLYQICDFQLVVPKNCVALGCLINTCFLSFWSTHKTTIFALTCLFSLLLCVKLFVLNKFGAAKNGGELSRVNRLALIDAANVCIFDFLPSFLANQFSQTQLFSFEKIGPYGAAMKLFGCAIEALLVYRTLVRKSGFQTAESSKAYRNTKKKVTIVGVGGAVAN
ncbi:unnamed protein product [Caenorhabditis sp. 36 PRJEB53466]|nr:unnamed protein product [Caenorhabditis sp. 36 PRJEB53466]